MSIIHEALKKAGQPVIAETNRPANKPAKIPLHPPVEQHRSKASTGWGAVFLWVALVLVAAPVLATLFHRSWRPSSTPAQTAVAPPTCSPGFNTFPFIKQYEPPSE